MNKAFDALLKEEVRNAILVRGKRPDGRGPEDIRPITIEVGVLPRTHGSGLFTRGQTQVLTVATLGTGDDEQMIDGLGLEDKQALSSTTTTSRRSASAKSPHARRQAAATSATARWPSGLVAVLPSRRRVPLRDPPGVARCCPPTARARWPGLRQHPGADGRGRADQGPGRRHRHGPGHERGRHASAGPDRHPGHRRRTWATWTSRSRAPPQGVTAFQMDIKISGHHLRDHEEALAQAREARLFILDKMTAVIAEPRDRDLALTRRASCRIKINPEKIGALIGPGGKMIRRITEETGCKIDIEDDGTVLVASTDGESAKQAIRHDRGLTNEVEVGEIYLGKVVRIHALRRLRRVPARQGRPGPHLRAGRLSASNKSKTWSTSATRSR